MTTTNLGNDATSIVADDTDLIIERTFAAPRTAVWEAWTSPEHISAWWGPHGTTARVDAMDVTPGGRWRWIADEGGEHGGAPFTGEYQEVERPARFVRTLTMDVPPFNEGPAAVETVTFAETAGVTTMTYVTRFPAKEILQGAVDDGMTKGTVEQFERLDDLLKRIS
ncbi:SRPBCC domain-containing protein [Micromonospora sediminicola]|uniref:SRPBCC domain-containing protein n=1 Tax=Micromonospora sediminicola TaxID=946078 RepID=UPI00340CF31C